MSLNMIHRGFSFIFRNISASLPFRPRSLDILNVEIGKLTFALLSSCYMKQLSNERIDYIDVDVVPLLPHRALLRIRTPAFLQ